MPDLTLVLDLPAGVGIGRIADRAHDSFEQMGLAFHERVRAGYLEIAREEKDRVAVVAGDQGEEETRKAIRALVASTGSGDPCAGGARRSAFPLSAPCVKSDLCPGSRTRTGPRPGRPDALLSRRPRADTCGHDR